MLFRNEKKDRERPSWGPVRVPLLPLRDIIVFPHMVVPLFRRAATLDQGAGRGDAEAESDFLSSQKDAKTNEPDRGRYL